MKTQTPEAYRISDKTRLAIWLTSYIGAKLVIYVVIRKAVKFVAKD